MKKSILSIAVMAASLFSFSAFAQAPSKPAENCSAAKECVNGKKACQNPQNCKNPQNCQNGPACAPQRPCAADPFAGINLSQDQKTKLNALKEQRMTKRDAADKSRKDRFQQRDSMARACKKEYLESVKEILTPDQYVIFLENAVLSNLGQDRGIAPHRMHAMKKDGKDIKKGDFKKGDRKVDMRRAEKKADK